MLNRMWCVGAVRDGCGICRRIGITSSAARSPDGELGDGRFGCDRYRYVDIDVEGFIKVDNTE
jgi:hypothetical protein